MGDLFVAEPATADEEIPVLRGYWDNALRITPSEIAGVISATASMYEPVEAPATFPDLKLEATSSNNVTASAMVSKWFLDSQASFSDDLIGTAMFIFEDVSFISVGENLIISLLLEPQGAGLSQPNADKGGSPSGTTVRRRRRIRKEFGENLSILQSNVVLIRIATEVYQARSIVASIQFDGNASRTAKVALREALKDAGVEYTESKTGELAVRREFAAPLPFGFRGLRLFVETATGELTGPVIGMPHVVFTDQRINELEADNAMLRAILEGGELQTVEAAGHSIDMLLANLSELGSKPGDVTKFRVDGGYVYRVRDSILFGFASTQLSDEGRKVLQEVVADINSRPHGKVYVQGHTDSVPVRRAETLARFPHGNLQLSAARAVEVGGFLMEAGQVDPKQLVVIGFGPSEPVAPNDTETNRRKNRRVEIFVSRAGRANGSR